MLKKLMRSPRMLRHIMNIWPPFLGAGIHVESISADWSEARVRMSLRFYNQNYVGTHFGGSLFAMTDPFLMLLTMNQLGPDYTVWDKAGTVDFRKPGRTRVFTTIKVDQEFLDELRTATGDGKAHFVTRDIEVIDTVGDVVAVVSKTLYVRRRRTKQKKIESNPDGTLQSESTPGSKGVTGMPGYALSRFDCFFWN